MAGPLMQPPRRTSLLLAPALVVVLTGAGFAVHRWHEEHSCPDSASVAMPAPNSSPRRVVGVYMHAMEVCDYTTARSLVDSGSRQSWQPWLSGPSMIAAGHVTGSMRLNPALVRSSGRPGSQMVDVFVQVTFQNTDASLDDGTQPWSYEVALSPAGRWRLVDQGAD